MKITLPRVGFPVIPRSPLTGRHSRGVLSLPTTDDPLSRHGALRCLLAAALGLAAGPVRAQGPQPAAHDGLHRGSPFYQRSEPAPVEHQTWPTYDAHAIPGQYEPNGGGDVTFGQLAPQDGLQPAGYQPPETLELPEQILGNPYEQAPEAPRTFRQRIWRPGGGCDPVAGCEATPWIVPRKTELRTTVLPGNGDDLGLVNVDGRMTLALPSVPGFTVTPGTIVSFVDGPVRTDLPSDVYSVWVEFQYMKQFTPQWAMQLAVAPGLYTDFRNTSSDAVRITGRALAFYAKSRQTQIAFGVVFLDRENVFALPAVGLIHSPSETVRLEAIFPRPRAMFRVKKGATGEGWVYLAGEFGGGSWAIERANGTDDIVTYGDLRLIAGFEWRNGPVRRAFVEGGWVFERDVEYDSGLGDFSPDQTGMIRAGVAF